jgi:16S rRNA processing protein RimM
LPPRPFLPPPDASPVADDFVVLGRILGPYGVKGWLKINPFTTEHGTLLGHPAWWIRPRGGSGAWREMALESGREHGATLVAQLAGITDREAAVLLKGSDVGVPRAALPAAADDEIYYSDLVGLAVVNRQGVPLGTVSSVQDYGAHPVFRVTDETTAVERLIPFVDAYVDSVDLAAGRIDVDWQPDY